MLNEGWKCPGCGRCYSPSMMQCYKCGEETLTVQGSTTCNHVWGTPTTAGVFCVYCGTQQIPAPSPGNTCGGTNG